MKRSIPVIGKNIKKNELILYLIVVQLSSKWSINSNDPWISLWTNEIPFLNLLTTTTMTIVQSMERSNISLGVLLEKDEKIKRSETNNFFFYIFLLVVYSLSLSFSFLQSHSITCPCFTKFKMYDFDENIS